MSVVKLWDKQMDFIPKGLRPRIYMKDGMWTVDARHNTGLRGVGQINQEALLYCIFLNEQLHNEPKEKDTK
jgi:hypothetical protein